MANVIKLDYFKASGKWYSEGELIVPESRQPWDIVDDIRDLQARRQLPGLAPGHSLYHITCTLSGVPFLILARI